jgi:hypothetical protein
MVYEHMIIEMESFSKENNEDVSNILDPNMVRG